MFTLPAHTQDVCDLALHTVADAPPPNWVSVEVRLLCSLSSPIDTRPERAVHTKSRRHTLDTRYTPRLCRPPPHRPPQPQPTLTSQSRYRSQTCPTRHSRSLPRHLTMLAQSTLQATNPECAPYSVRSFKDPSLYLLSVGHMIEITILYHPTWQTSLTSQTVGQRHPSPSLNPSCSSHTRNNARGYTLLTARWSTVISLLRALLNPTQCLTEDGKELTQVCVIDYESGIVVYDRLVKPPKPVIGCLPK